MTDGGTLMKRRTGTMIRLEEQRKSKALRDGGRVYESVSEPLIRASRVVPYKVQKSSQGTDGANRSSTEIIF